MEQKDEGYFSYCAKNDKAYRKMCALAVAEYNFTPNEIVVLMFLSNNPGLDSASDIAHYRNIAKGLVDVYKRQSRECGPINSLHSR